MGNEIAGLSARLNVATHRLLTHIRCFDELGGWHRQGAQSCAHWLSWRVGLDPGAAREKVRVARALGALPKIDEAFAAGRLSYAKVRAVTRVANATNEEQVLEVALAATGAQLERICRGYRRATESESEAAADRRVRARVLGDGLVKMEIVLAADEADLLLKAIEHARTHLSPPIPREPGCDATEAGTASAPRASAADGLVHLASVSLAGGQPAAGLAVPERHQVVVHVDRDLISPERSFETTLAATLEDGTRVSSETLRPTSLENLLLLCSFHHREIHEGGFSLHLTAEGEVDVRTPDGARLPAQPPLAGDVGPVDWRNDWWEGSSARIDTWTTTPSWDGEPLDYEAVVDALITT